jgi:hypothetical protein
MVFSSKRGSQPIRRFRRLLLHFHPSGDPRPPIFIGQGFSMKEERQFTAPFWTVRFVALALTWAWALVAVGVGEYDS